MTSSTFWGKGTSLHVVANDDGVDGAIDDERNIAHERVESFWGMFLW